MQPFPLPERHACLLTCVVCCNPPPTRYPCLQNVLFEQESLRLVSRHHNLIAFTLDVGLLLKVWL